MAKRRIYRATFADGTTKDRGTTTMTYAWAWRCGGQTGFSSEQHLAVKGASSSRGSRDIPIEVVPCVEVSK